MEETKEINRTENQIFYSDGSIGPTEKAKEYMNSCGLSDRKREDSLPNSELSKIRRQAANHRWAYQAQREEFLSEVIFDSMRNRYFKVRCDKAMEGLNDGYKLKKMVIPGRYKGISSVLVKNSHNDKVYSVRLFKNGGKRGLASCTCPDFQRNKTYKVPCKHIWMVLMKGPFAGDPIRGWR